MKCRSFKLIRADIDSLAPITNKESFLAALPLIVEAATKIKAMRATIKKIGDLADALNDKASAYALGHESVFADGLRPDGKGVLHGNVEVEGRLFHFSAGFKGYMRSDGDSMTQGFLDGLPEKWTRGKLELDATGIERLGVTSEQLEKAGLVRKPNNVWSVPDTSEDEGGE